MWMSRYWCAAKKISLVNEVLVGLEWRGLIGQQQQPTSSLMLWKTCTMFKQPFVHLRTDAHLCQWLI